MEQSAKQEGTSGAAVTAAERLLPHVGHGISRVARELNERRQVILRYATPDGRIEASGNPNGSVENIAGICNREGNVFGLMPHPDRACEERLGSTDGLKIFQSMMQTIEARRERAA